MTFISILQILASVLDITIRIVEGKRLHSKGRDSIYLTVNIYTSSEQCIGVQFKEAMRGERDVYEYGERAAQEADDEMCPKQNLQK